MKAMILINMPEHCGVCEFRGMPGVTPLGPESYVSGWNDCVHAIKNYN